MDIRIQKLRYFKHKNIIVIKEHKYIYEFNIYLQLKFSSGSFATYFDVRYSDKIPDVSSTSIADNVIDKVKALIPNGKKINLNSITFI